LAWKTDVGPRAAKALRKLDRQTAERIVRFLDELDGTQNPRNRGQALVGPRAGLWRYRVGDYRLVCQLRDQQLIILVIEIGHRSDIYR
jgi:mRNA interferase RelE/StbE